jgi:uncharacterized protein YyaL (SSP411 family)
MNDWFFNVKVDREERPDIDNVYMLATQLITAGHRRLAEQCVPDARSRAVLRGRLFRTGGLMISDALDLPTILKSLHEQWEQEPGRLRERAQGFVTVLRQYQQKATASSETSN